MSIQSSVDLYHKRAAELELLAAETKLTHMREYYLRLAGEWRMLAASHEKQLSRFGSTVGENNEED